MKINWNLINIEISQFLNEDYVKQSPLFIVFEKLRWKGEQINKINGKLKIRKQNTITIKWRNQIFDLRKLDWFDYLGSTNGNLMGRNPKRKIINNRIRHVAHNNSKWYAGEDKWCRWLGTRRLKWMSFMAQLHGFMSIFLQFF